jgi:hypothetical protein
VKKFESFEGPSLTLPNTCVRFPRSPEALVARFNQFERI